MDLSNIEWKSGKPPSIGWWLCDGDARWWRWWDGVQWSCGAKEGAKLSTVTKAASKPANWSYFAYWCDYWPIDAICSRDGVPIQPSSSTPKPAKKANKRVTMYVVQEVSRDRFLIGTLATFKSMSNAKKYAESLPCYTRIDKIRFRTPEA